MVKNEKLAKAYDLLVPQTSIHKMLCTCHRVCGVFIYFICTLEIKNDAAGFSHFLATYFFLYTLKTSENLRCFKGWKKIPEGWNWLAHLGPMYPSYRNQSVDLYWKYFLYEENICLIWIKVRLTPFQNERRRREVFWGIGLKNFTCFLGREESSFIKVAGEESGSFVKIFRQFPKQLLWKIRKSIGFCLRC